MNRLIPPRYVYLDAVAWNALCDSAADPEDLIQGLAKRQRTLVLGPHVIYELAKTFASPQPGSLKRGKQLFGYIQHYVRRSTPCLQENGEILRQEALRVSGEVTKVRVCFEGDQYNSLVSEVAKLAAGDFDSRASSFIRKKKGDVQLVRSIYAREQQTLKRPAESFPSYVRRCSGRAARQMLLLELIKQFPSGDLKTLKWIARKLSADSRNRLTQSLVRAWLYLAWRSARAGSLPRDVADDCSHMVNASYCQTYVTKESSQLEFAREIIPKTEIQIYDGSQEIGAWLANLQ